MTKRFLPHKLGANYLPGWKLKYTTSTQNYTSCKAYIMKRFLQNSDIISFSFYTISWQVFLEFFLACRDFFRLDLWSPWQLKSGKTQCFIWSDIFTQLPFVTILYSWKFWKNKKVEFSIPVLHFRYASAVKKVKKCVILDQEFRAVISGTWFPNELITCMDVSCVWAFSKTTRSHKIHKIFHLQ